MASTYISRTPSSASNRKTWTWSAWVKRSKLGGGNQVLFEAMQSGGFVEKALQFTSSDRLEYDHDIAGTDYTIYSERRFRDTNGWYHIVIAKDTTQATETDRIKIYVNGEQLAMTEESLGYPPQNYEGAINNTYAHHIGANDGASSEVFDGLMSHVHFCDGTALAPTVFGETDSTTGEWKIITSPSFTPGTNGFTILKDGNTITDQSANSNNFTLSNGTLTKTEDNPSNIFCTLNPLGLSNDVTFACGNNNATYGTSGTRSIVIGTLGASSGKYYWEIEIQGNANANNGVLGVSMNDNETGYAVAGETNQSWGLRGYDGAVHNNNSSVGGTWATFTNGDKIGVAINLDNEQGGLNKLYFSKNGTWLNGADPSNHSSTTGVIGITKPENGVSGFYFPVVSDAGSSATPKFKCNFGNGYFGTVAVSSAGTNASGIGIFEYDVPTGFTALSTKGLNE